MIAKDELNTIYRQALIAYRIMLHDAKQLHEIPNFGLCGAINAALEHLGESNAKPCPYIDLYMYPHIFRHKKGRIGLWWELTNTNIRVRILNNAIKSTNP